MVGAVFFLQSAVHADDEIEIFSDGVSAKASHLHNQVPLKDSECSGNYGEHVEAGPSFAADQKGSQVFDDLHDLNRTLREADFLDLIVNNAGAVQDPDDPADCHHAAGIGEHPCHDANERFFFEN